LSCSKLCRQQHARLVPPYGAVRFTMKPLPGRRAVDGDLSVLTTHIRAEAASQPDPVVRRVDRHGELAGAGEGPAVVSHLPAESRADELAQQEVELVDRAGAAQLGESHRLPGW